MTLGKSAARLAATLGMLTLTQTLAQAQEITVRVNGNTVSFADAHPQRIEGRVLVPLRGVLEEIGADISWNEATQTVKATMGERTIQLTLGRRTALVNGESVVLRVPALRIGGSTMVPLRFIGEALGGSVDWDEPGQQVRISTNTPPGNRRPDGRNRERERAQAPTSTVNNRGSSRTILMRVDGREEAFGDAKPFFHGDDLMVPLDQLSQHARFSYRFDATQNVVTVSNKKLRNAIGSRWIDKDGQRIRLESPSEVRGGTVFVPLEFIELASDQTVTWNADTHWLTITYIRP